MMGETSYRIEITGRENFEWQGILARNGEPPVRFESLLQMILMMEGKENQIAPDFLCSGIFKQFNVVPGFSLQRLPLA